MGRLASIPATFLAAACLVATAVCASDRPLPIINEGEPLGAWRPVAETLAVPAYPGIVEDKSEDACVTIGYLVKADGSTSDFAVLSAWSSKVDGLKPTDPHFLPYSQNALAAVQRWRFQTDGGATSRRQVFTATTFAFSTTGADPEGLKGRCRIDNLKEFVSKIRDEARKRNQGRGSTEVSAPLAPPKND